VSALANHQVALVADKVTVQSNWSNRRAT